MKGYIIIFLIGLLCCKSKTTVVDHINISGDTTNIPLLTNDSIGLSSASVDSTFEYFVELFKIKCSANAYSKYDYFFGNARCPLPDNLVKRYLKHSPFNKYGYYSIDQVTMDDYIFLVYGQVDVSGDGFYMINIASFDMQGNAIEDLQLLYINGGQYFKCQPLFQLKDGSLLVTTPDDCDYDIVIDIQDNGKMLRKDARQMEEDLQNQKSSSNE